MKILITKMSSGGFDQESFDSVKDALEFFAQWCICSGCQVTQSQIKREEFDNPRDYEREKHFALIDDWDQNGDWDALHQLLASPCGCEYDVEVVD
jgi:hypothetical protein